MGRVRIESSPSSSGRQNLCPAKNTGDQPGGCATVTYIQDTQIRGNKTMQSPAMNQNFSHAFRLDINTHFAEAGRLLRDSLHLPENEKF